MVDPMISLAFSVQSGKGTYALLIGSGVSRSAGIPTGWEVMLDLTKQVARLRGDDCKGDPESWYRDTFDQEPDYAKLLEMIAKTPAERQQLLRQYFEPNDEEREQGLKVPQAAHKAIADLVLRGYVRRGSEEEKRGQTHSPAALPGQSRPEQGSGECACPLFSASGAGVEAEGEAPEETGDEEGQGRCEDARQ